MQWPKELNTLYFKKTPCSSVSRGHVVTLLYESSSHVHFGDNTSHNTLHLWRTQKILEVIRAGLSQPSNECFNQRVKGVDRPKLL